MIKHTSEELWEMTKTRDMFWELQGGQNHCPLCKKLMVNGTSVSRIHWKGGRGHLPPPIPMGKSHSCWVHTACWDQQVAWWQDPYVQHRKNLENWGVEDAVDPPSVVEERTPIIQNEAILADLVCPDIKPEESRFWDSYE